MRREGYGTWSVCVCVCVCLSSLLCEYTCNKKYLRLQRYTDSKIKKPFSEKLESYLLTIAMSAIFCAYSVLCTRVHVYLRALGSCIIHAYACARPGPAIRCSHIMSNAHLHYNFKQRRGFALQCFLLIWNLVTCTEHS